MKQLIIIVCALCLTACISRLSRPEISGQIVDEQGQRLAEVHIGENLSGVAGDFKLPEQRYHAFFLTEFLVMEAPAVYVRERVSKAGFRDCWLTYRSRYGGGQPAGAAWHVGKIVLQSVYEADLSHQMANCRLKTEEK